MNRAHSTFEIKSFDEEQRTFEGIASTPSPDRTDDVVDPMGAKFTLPLPMKWQHGKGDIKDSIGWITHATPSPDGIHVRGQMAKPKDDYPQTLKDQLNGCWVRVRDKLTRGLSIGFTPIEAVPIKGSYGVHHKRWEWLELSPVDIPMNAEASILTVKQYDETPGAERESRPTPVQLGSSLPKSGTCFLLTPKGTAMSKTASEQVTDLEATRAAKVARMLAVMNKASDEGRSTDAAEAEEADTLDTEIKALDADLVRYNRAAQLQAEQAKAVELPATQQRFAPMILRQSRDEADKFQGQSFTRMVIAKAMGDLTRRPPSQIAHERWGQTNPTLVEILKVNEVAGGGTGTGEWGMELAKSDSRYTGDFIEYLYGLTVFDKLPLTRVPANVFVKGQDGEGIAYWVGESKAIPVTTLDFMDVELRVLKVATIAVVSNQLIRYSSPDAELMVRNGLAQACAKRIDQTFLSTAAAVTGVSPAGILNGLTPITPSGTDADAIRTDIAALYAPFIAANNVADPLWIVTTPALAKTISLMVNPLGQQEFNGTVTSTGGSLLGDPVVIGSYVGAGDVILLNPKDIWRIGDTGLEVMTSREATIEQSSAPTGATDTPVAASQFITSMYQSDSTAVRILRELNFQKRRTTAVAYIDAAAYAP